MRQTIVFDSLYEEEARPSGVYSRLRQLALETADVILKQKETFIDIPCPACASEEREDSFRLHGYTYHECQVCGTVYLSPRPGPQSMQWYLMDSPVAIFRRSKDFLNVRMEFINILSSDRSSWIVSLCHANRLPPLLPVIDINERYPKILTDLARQISGPIYSVTPLYSESEITDSIFTVRDLGDLQGAHAQFVSAFDVFEHTFSPSELVKSVRNFLAPGGLFALTTRAGSGFDVQALWGHMDTIFPLEHINLFSVSGVRKLLELNGFDLVELSTPGQLDVQVVVRALNENKKIPGNRFLKSFLLNVGSDVRIDFQQFLQKHLLSSYMRVVAQKTDK